jgi:hypothetical protein
MAELTVAPFGNSKTAIALDPDDQALRTQLWKVEGTQVASAAPSSARESSSDTAADETAVPLTDETEEWRHKYGSSRIGSGDGGLNAKR